MNEYQRLVALLVKRTNEGTANWQPTSRNGVFSLSLPDYSVWISMIRSDEDTNDVMLQIVNSDGAVIDTIKGRRDRRKHHRKAAVLQANGASLPRCQTASVWGRP